MIKVTRCATADALDPFTREIDSIELPQGSRIKDAIPDGWSVSAGETLVYLNTSRCEDLDQELTDGDIVHFFGGVTDPATWALLAISIISAVVSIAMMPDLPKTAPAPNPDGGSTYGYYGFSNSFRAEGDPVPVVYGRLRVAPPVINQVIVANSVSQQLSLSRREDMFVMMAISEGPIFGLGDFEGVVESQADQDALTGALSVVVGAGLQINGISASNFVSLLDWRTGTLNQNAFSGSQGYVDYNNTSVVYDIGLTPLNGQLASIGDAAHAPGTYASPPITNALETEYVNQDIGVEVDNALVQIQFERGLYEQNASGGFDALTKTIRILYQETDSGGVGTGDWVLLPSYVVSSAQTISQVIDIPVSFVTPSSYVPSAQQGYFRGSTRVAGPTTNYWLSNADTTAHFNSRPSSPGDSTQQWTMGAWIHSRNNIGHGGCNHFLFSAQMPSVTTIDIDNTSSVDGFHGPLRSQIGPNESGMLVTLRNDIDGMLGAANRTFLVVEIWVPGITGHLSRWYADVGAATSWGGQTTDPPTGLWKHVAIKYDGQAAGGPTVTAVVDGVMTYQMSYYSSNSQPATTMYPRWDVASGTAANWSINVFGSNVTQNFENSETDICEFFLYDGILDAGTLNLLGTITAGVDIFGHKTNGVRQVLEGDPNAKMLLPMTTAELQGGSYFYRDYANNATGTVTEAAGSYKLNVSNTQHRATGSPIWSSTDGLAEKSYWKTQVFVSEQTATNTSNNTATITTITGLSSQEYVYPSTAVASVMVEADEQVNNQQPQITMLVKGRIVDTWEGALDEEGNPALTPAWSRNPAWIAADLLTNPTYGLGAELSSSSVDWPSFASWAAYCDEGVPDAFGDVAIFGVKATGAVNSIEVITLYIGLETTVSPSTLTLGTIPQSWQAATPAGVRSYVSINGITSGGLADAWKTSDDNANGVNQASNLLGIRTITYDDGALGGFAQWVAVDVEWNRLDDQGNPIWPDGVSTGDIFLHDDFSGLNSVATASGFEERCRFDGVFDQKDQSAWEAVLQIFSAGRAMPIKAGQKILASVDRPRPVVAVFGQGNIINNSLELSYTGPKQRPNSLEGDIIDQDANYEKRTVVVDHSSIQDPTLFETFRKERADFRGVVRRSQAMRDATYRLNKYFLTRRHAKFQVGPDAVNLLPGDRILVSHDVPQYGYSGRLRADQVTSNTFPVGGSLFASWDREGGPCALSRGALITQDSATTPPIASTHDVDELTTLPTAPDQSGPAASQGESGADSSTANKPEWVQQHVCTSSTLYPPNPDFGPLTQISSASYSCAYSIHVKEPSSGASQVVRLNVYRFVDAGGTVIDSSYVGDFTWASGAITSTYTSTGITGSVTSLGSGWYRLGVVYSNATAGGSVGDYLQARVVLGATSGGGSSGTFLRVADGGKGTNFLKFGDPLDCTRSDWTRYNNGTSGIIIENVVYAPPFYTATDGSFGNVARLYKPSGIAFGTTPPNLVQAHTLSGGSGIPSWTGQTINVTGYARIGAANTTTNTTLYLDLRFADTVDSNNVLNGDGARYTFTGGGSGSWSAFGTPTKTEASGTVGVATHSLSYVRQTSSADDANWVQWNAQVAYTPSSGVPVKVVVGISVDGSDVGNCECYVWGVRLHGQSSSSVSVSPYWHRRMLFAGAMFEDGATSIGTFSTGSGIQLDRDVTLEAGNEYEVLLRSSFAPDSSLGTDSSEVVTVAATEVPTSGSLTKAANVALQVSTPDRFTAHEGDLYSFGKSNQTSEDFIISSIDLDPATMQRAIECEEYNPAVYEDTAFGTTGTGTISDLPSPSTQASASSQMGVGLPTDSAYGGRSFRFEVVDESESDQSGNFVARLGIYWRWPEGMRTPRDVRLYIERAPAAADVYGAHDPAEFIGQTRANAGHYTYSNALLVRGRDYKIRLQPVGSTGSAMSLEVCPSATVTIRKTARLFALAPPSVTTATRGWQQMYYLERIASSRVVEIVEGRVGGWKLGSPAFVIDPDVSNTASDSTLVGQLSTPTGRTETRVFCRGRTAQGHYGRSSTITGTEQLKDVLYDHSVSAENDYTNLGSISSEMTAGGDVLRFLVSSTALSAEYFPDSINLGKAERVLVNCVAEAIQVRPETLADLPYTLDSEKIRRWSFEGPMDDLDGDDAELRIEWRWSSTSSTSSETYRIFRPGEVYAKKIDFRITFIRPTASYNIRMSRLVVQALLPPNFKPGDVDGGSF